MSLIPNKTDWSGTQPNPLICTLHQTYPHRLELFGKLVNLEQKGA